MSTAELKSDLHRLIVETDDIHILKRIQDIFTALRSRPAEALSDYEKKMIEQGLEDIKAGKVLINHEVKEKFQNWRKQKRQ